MTDIIEQSGALVPEFAHLNSDQSTAIALARAEIDMQIATAIRFPRKIERVAARIMSFATMDEETAEECCYALVYGKDQGEDRGGNRDNAPVEGPSIRLAEIALQSYGNCRAYSRIVDVNRKEKYIEAEGIFHDLETNAMQLARSRRRISGKKGNLFPEHLIITTGNAAASIAKRNAILAGIPRGLYRPAYLKAREIIAGTAQTLVQSRQKVIDSYAHYGVTPEQICILLGIDSMMEFTTSHVVQMRAMFASIRNNEVSVEDVFAPPKAKTEPAKDPLSNEGAEEYGHHGKPVSGGAVGGVQSVHHDGGGAIRDQGSDDGARSTPSEPGTVQDAEGTGTEGEGEKTGQDGQDSAAGGKGNGGTTEEAQPAAVAAGAEIQPIDGSWTKAAGLKLAEAKREFDAVQSATQVAEIAGRHDSKWVMYEGPAVKAKFKELHAEAKDRTKPKRSKL